MLERGDGLVEQRHEGCVGIGFEHPLDPAVRVLQQAVGVPNPLELAGRAIGGMLPYLAQVGGADLRFTGVG